MKATKVTAGLAESNGRLLLGIWRDSLHVTCGLTACTLGSAPGPTLGNEYGKNFTLTTGKIFCKSGRRSLARALKARVSSWSSQQCLGDVLSVAFSSSQQSIKSYVNYFQSYPALLVHLDRCTEQFPAFRTLLRRRQRTADAAGRTYSCWLFSAIILFFCSLAVLDPRVGHTMDVLSPFISVLCHSD